METTIELLDHFRPHGPDSTLAMHLHVSPTTISMARKVGRVSPELAAKLALELTSGMDDETRAEAVKTWVTIAVAEQLGDIRRDWLLDQIGIHGPRKPLAAKTQPSRRRVERAMGIEPTS